MHGNIIFYDKPVFKQFTKEGFCQRFAMLYKSTIIQLCLNLPNQYSKRVHCKGKRDLTSNCPRRKQMFANDGHCVYWQRSLRPTNFV